MKRPSSGSGILLFSWMAACGLALPSPTAADGKSLTVMQYLGERASRMSAKLPGIPDDRGAWELRRQVVRKQLAVRLGLPDRMPMRAKITKTREDDGLVVEDVMYLWADNAYVAANVVRPKEITGALPALVMPPGWLGDLQQDFYRPFVYQMAQRGYVILFIDDPHVRLRAAPYQGLYCAASAAGTQCMGIQVFDTLRGLDYLLTRSDVDPNRIGVAGLCQGSEQTWLAAALDDRFKIAALGVVGAITVRDWAEKVAPHQNEFRFWAPYFHEITMHTDLQFVYSSIAPRPLLLVDGTYRNFWPESGYRRVSEMADLIFGLYAKPDALTKLPAKSDWGIEEVRQWLGATLKYKQPAAN